MQNASALCPFVELKEAVEDVLPSLVEQGITVLLMAKHCNTPGIDSFCDPVDKASDSPLPRSLRSHVTFKSPAVYIYTSGTTGIGMAAFFFVCFGFQFYVKNENILTLQAFLSLQELFYLTCGVSGLPKAAVVNQNRLLTALAVLSSNGVRANDVIYLNLPLYHTAGFIIGFIGSIETGKTTEL